MWFASFKSHLKPPTTSNLYTFDEEEEEGEGEGEEEGGEEETKT